MKSKAKYDSRRTAKIQNRNAILKALSREKQTFQELLEATKISQSTLAVHLREMVREGIIQKTYDDRNRRIYEIVPKGLIEELIVEGLMKYLGSLTTQKLLEASSRGEKTVEIEEFYDVQGFLRDFVEKNFKIRDIEPQKLLKAFKKKYGELAV